MHNAKGLTVKIRERLGGQIRQACAGTLVPESFLAGLISVENAQLDVHAVRFEKATYAQLKALRNPLKVWRRGWNGITQADLKGASDEALVNLASSFGYTQIMGWWSILLSKQVKLQNAITVSDIRDQQKHLRLAVRLLQFTAAVHLKSNKLGNALRIWNTGRADGKTHDPLYVDHALAVMNEYRKLESANVRTSDFVLPRTTIDAPAVTSAPGLPAISP